MKLRQATADGRIKVGSRVLVRSDAQGESPYRDVVRGVFTQHVLREPYARNEEVEALVLTERSWCRVDSVIFPKTIEAKEVIDG
jgi:hypothetical protein